MEEEKKYDIIMKVTKDKLAIWTPLQKKKEKYFVEAMIDDYDGFRIFLKGEKEDSEILKISFVDVLSYRNTDESYLLNIWHNTDKKVLGNIFYTIENSSYIDFFNGMTHDLYSNWKVNHYAIYTLSDCIDILSEHEPHFEVVTEIK